VCITSLEQLGPGAVHLVPEDFRSRPDVCRAHLVRAHRPPGIHPPPGDSICQRVFRRL